jgi:hypothetical protein
MFLQRQLLQECRVPLLAQTVFGSKLLEIPVATGGIAHLVLIDFCPV